MVVGRVVDSNINSFSSFSGNLFALFIYYLGVEDVGLGVVVAKAAFVNCSGDMTIVFYSSIFQTYTGFFYVRKVAFSFWAGPLVDYVLFHSDEILSLGYIRIDIRVLAPLKMTCTQVC